MLRLLYALLLGLVGAGIVHIVILFLLPGYSTRDAWAHLSAVTEPYTPLLLDGQHVAGRTLPPVNPFIRAAACRFDLSDGMLHVRGDGQQVPFWSMAVYDHNGLNVFSINDRATNERALDFIVLSPPQLLRMRNQLTTEFARTVFIEADVDEGLVLVRAFVPDESWENVVASFLGGMSCEPRALP